MLCLGCVVDDQAGERDVHVSLIHERLEGLVVYATTAAELYEPPLGIGGPETQREVCVGVAQLGVSFSTANSVKLIRQAHSLVLRL